MCVFIISLREDERRILTFFFVTYYSIKGMVLNFEKKKIRRRRILWDGMGFLFYSLKIGMTCNDYVSSLF